VPLTWGFDTWSGCRELDRKAPSLTVAYPCIWHDSGTDLRRRQSATTAAASTCHARVPRRTLAGLSRAIGLLGTLRSFSVDSRADLSEWPGGCRVGLGRFPCTSPLVRVRAPALMSSERADDAPMIFEARARRPPLFFFQIIYMV
jgi:hypothetical protein